MRLAVYQPLMQTLFTFFFMLLVEIKFTLNLCMSILPSLHQSVFLVFTVCVVVVEMTSDTQSTIPLTISSTSESVPNYMTTSRRKRRDVSRTKRSTYSDSISESFTTIVNPSSTGQADATIALTVSLLDLPDEVQHCTSWARDTPQRTYSVVLHMHARHPKHAPHTSQIHTFHIHIILFFTCADIYFDERLSTQHDGLISGSKGKHILPLDSKSRP